MHTITTFTGKEVNPLHFERRDLDIVDIAHALSMICRFNGHCRVFYSVAEHSVLVSRLCPPEYAFEALLHDGAEAYLGDIPTPVKRTLIEFKAAEQRACGVMAECFDLPASESSVVKAADQRAFRIEMSQLMGQPSGGEPEILLACLAPAAAKAAFLDRFYALRRP